jgi:hypothetical protein
MDIVTYLLEISKYTFSGLIVVYAAFYLHKGYSERTKMIEILQLKKASQSQLLPLRLQAYERLILLVERLNPANLLLRLHSGDRSAGEMRQLIISEVRSEFLHNISQQLYASERAWQITKRIKDDTIALVNSAAKNLPDDSSSLELNKAILTHLAGLDENPYDTALFVIKQDIHQLF